MEETKAELTKANIIADEVLYVDDIVIIVDHNRLV